jgi:FkbM family methyltransferase
VARVAARTPVGINRRWLPLLAVKRWLLARLRRDTIAVDGFDLALDPSDSLRLGLGDRHQPELIGCLDRLVGPGDHAVDGGAHIGYLTLHLARHCAHVWSFEPDPGSFALLQRNLGANRIDNVTARPAALWSSAGTAPLYLRDDHHADHRMWDPGDGRPAIEVPTVRLDDALPASETVRLIKLDLQGAEAHALEGMSRCLRQPDLILVLELWPRGLRGCGSCPESLLASLGALGFRLWQLAASGELIPVVPDRLLRWLEPPSRLGQVSASLRSADWIDLVCARDPAVLGEHPVRCRSPSLGP